jgi:hypothetical protein
MRSTDGGTDQSASTAEQDRCNDARASVLILIAFDADGSADGKADEGSDQSMAPIASLAPGCFIFPAAGIWHLGRDYEDRPMLGKV